MPKRCPGQFGIFRTSKRRSPTRGAAVLEWHGSGRNRAGAAWRAVERMQVLPGGAQRRAGAAAPGTASAVLIFLAGALVGGWVGWRWGWNATVRMYRDRDIARAEERAEADSR